MREKESERRYAIYSAKIASRVFPLSFTDPRVCELPLKSSRDFLRFSRSLSDSWSPRMHRVRRESKRPLIGALLLRCGVGASVVSSDDELSQSEFNVAGRRNRRRRRSSQYSTSRVSSRSSQSVSIRYHSWLQLCNVILLASRARIPRLLERSSRRRARPFFLSFYISRYRELSSIAKCIPI